MEEGDEVLGRAWLPLESCLSGGNLSVVQRLQLDRWLWSASLPVLRKVVC